MGLVLGSLRLPAVILASGSAATAAGTNIAVSTASALTAGIAHARAGRVDWRIAAWMTPPSVAAPFLGGYFGGRVPETKCRPCSDASGFRRGRSGRTSWSASFSDSRASSGHAVRLEVDWPVLAVSVAAAVPGAWLGARLTGRMSEQTLKRAIGAALVAVGLAVAVAATL